MRVEALGGGRKALQRRTSDDFTEACIAQIAGEPLLLQSNRQVDTLAQRESEDISLSDA